MIRWRQFSIWHLIVAVTMAAALLWWFRIGDPVDSALAAEVPVVLRIENSGMGSGSKYIWTEVKVLKIYKNESGFVFSETLPVASYSFGDGIPGGMSTVYLVPYGDPIAGNWKIYEVPDRTITGVSHHVTQ